MSNKRAILYARTSRKDSTEISIESQLAMGLAHAHEQGYDVIAQLAEPYDQATPGHDLHLPQITKIRDMARQKQFDVLVVRELDRLSRSVAKQLLIEEELGKFGIEIDYVMADYEKSPEGRLTKNVRAIIAEYEREKITERTLRGKRDRLKLGSTMMSLRRPFGYQIVRLDNGLQTFEIDPTESAMVKQIFSWYLSGDSLGTIAHRLTDMQFPTVGDSLPGKPIKKSKNYGYWVSTYVRRILQYRGYLGVWEYHDKQTKETFQIEIPAIIDQKTFDLAQKQIEINKQNSTRNTKYDYLMARRLTCPDCGGAMSARTTTVKNKRYQQYYCTGAIKGKKSYLCTNKTCYRVARVDSAIWQFVLDLFDNPLMLEEKLMTTYHAQQTNNSPIQTEIETLTSLISQHTEHVNSLTETLLMLPKNSKTKQTIVDQITEIESTIAKLETQHADTQKRLVESEQLTLDVITGLVTTAKTLGQDKKFKQALHSIENFGVKREIIEQLNIRASLYTDNGTQRMDISCYVGSGLYNGLNQCCLAIPKTQIPNYHLTHSIQLPSKQMV